METLERLCLACGLCCDGTLFDKVEFAAGESGDELRAAGLPLRESRAKQPVRFFRQPCRALCSDLKCSVYAARPQQCRHFECAVYKRLAAGQIEPPAAEALVKRARRKAGKVKRLLRSVGETDEASSLDLRLRRVQRWVAKGELGEEAAEAFSELGLAVHQLDLLAHRHFYTEE